MGENEERLVLKMIYEAEKNADVYREALLETSLENDQLYNDYCELYDKLCQISRRIDMVYAGLSNPEIALGEIESILKEVDQ